MLVPLFSLILFPLLVLFSIKRYPFASELNTELFSRSQTSVLKGILIIMVYFHHFSMVENGGVGIPYIETIDRFLHLPVHSLFEMAGPIAVGVFFMISGYVSYLEFSQAKNSYNRIIVKKIFRLYLPVMIFTIHINNFLCGLLWMWLAVMLCFRYFHNKRTLYAGVFFGNIAFILLCILLNKGSWWYDRIFPFCIGFCMAGSKQKIIRFFFKKRVYFPSVFVCLLGLLSSYLYFARGHAFIGIFLISLFASLTLLLVLFKITFKSRVFAWFGKYSWEFFSLHQLYFSLFMRFFNSASLIMLFSLCACALSAFVLHTLWFSFWNKRIPALQSSTRSV